MYVFRFFQAGGILLCRGKGRCHLAGKYKEAIELGKKLLVETPKSAGVHVNLMDAYFKARNENPTFYDKHIEFDQGIPIKIENPTEIIPYDKKQPLSEELKYFVENLDGKIEIADGRSGYEVVKVLEKAQELIDEAP